MAIASAVIGAAGTIYGISEGQKKNQEGRKMQREAQKLISQFNFDEFQNAYKDLQVSTLGADLRREELATTSAGIVDALRGGGNRAIVGGLGRVQAGINDTNRQIAADLDQQQKAIDFASAQEEGRIRDLKFQQQSAELAGYGQLLNTGLGLANQGTGNVMSGLASLGQLAGSVGAQFSSSTPTYKTPTPEVQTPINLQPADLSFPETQQMSSNAPDYSKIYGNILAMGGYNNYLG